MIIEVATIAVKEGHEAQFEAAVASAVEVFRRAKGCGGLHLQKCVEEPLRYDVVIRWETLENHTIDFRESALFQEWRALVGPHFAEAPSVRHYSVAMERVTF